MSAFRLWTEGFVNLIFPDVCTVCHGRLVNGEKIMCLDCALGLPRTNLHRVQPNAIHERLFSIGHPVAKAASLFYYYRENIYARLIHDTKYRGRPMVGRTLAAGHAAELDGYGFFDDMDVIVPVPLHFFKCLRRGYNQAEEIAHGLSETTGLPVVNALSASFHSTQTRKGAHERLRNVRGVYHVSDRESIDGRHILIVDDVITTGATMLSCIESIKQTCPSTRVSVYSLAITQLG
ncbi:MAG: ComF family protein [Bacteroides sp.]|nr:ComF family protein [Bacteroides sp.]